jgi:hypothetical protein
MTQDSVTRIPTETEIAYLAGVFDGEGMVAIKSQRRGVWRNTAYELVTEISNSSPKLIDWILDHFGGYVRLQPKESGRPHWKWTRSGEKARQLLECLLPYLTEKADQARVGIEFQRRQHDEMKNRIYVSGRRGPVPRTPEQMAYKEEAKQQLHRMKRVHGTSENVAFKPYVEPFISSDYKPKNQILSDEQIREIRASYTRYGETPQRVLAERYGVSRSTIALIVCGMHRPKAYAEPSQ